MPIKPILTINPIVFTSMDWKNLNNYFEYLPEGFVSELFADSDTPWSPLQRLQPQIQRFFTDKSASGQLQGEKTVRLGPDNQPFETAYFISRTSVLSEPFVDPNARIYIGAGCMVEAGATIKDHTIIENNCEIRQGAYIRGSVFVGEGSVVGHTTEIKNSVFIKHVEAGHFAYIGDSLIGAYSNLGAGTKISNLEFRSLKAKKQEQFPEIPLRIGKERVKTGIAKFGAIIGDGGETGCNSVLCPFVLLEPQCWVLPCHCVLKGVYGKGSILRPGRSKPKSFS